MVAACSPRIKTEAFNFDHGSVVERVNLREHVAWCHKPKDEDTQMLAEDYLRMGIARALKTEPLQPLADEISRTVLVVGGGITGITAALEAAAAGLRGHPGRKGRAPRRVLRSCFQAPGAARWKRRVE